MKRFLLLLMFAILFSVAFIQCKRCKDKSLGENDFTSSDLSVVPYNGNEKLVFNDASDDSVLYSGAGRSSVIINSQDAAVGDCAGDYFYYEMNHTQFLTAINHRSIDLYLSFADSVPTNIYKSFVISLDYPGLTEGHFQTHLFFNDLKLNEIRPGGRIKAFNDSIDIGPKKFYSVYTLNDENDTNKIVYYSFHKGVVGFVTAGGHLRYLLH